MDWKLFFLTLVVILFAGCYTIMKHPDIVDEQNPKFHKEIYFNDDCSSCHQQQSNNLAGISQPYLPRLNYIHQNTRWSYFYELPWWNRAMFSTYKSSGGSGPAGSTVLPTTSARSRFPGATSGGSGASTTSITGSSSGGTRVTGTGSSSATNTTIRTPQAKSGSKKTIIRSEKSGSKSKASRKVTRRKKK